ncbi:MAG: hypothetical protein QXX84_06945 [Sulfolobales archaeon]
MKLDLYLQEKVEPFNIVAIENLEIPEELVGTWNNQRATLEIPKELLDEVGLFDLEKWKGLARLYNTKRKARLQYDYKKGWRYVYYFPQKLYRAGVENIKVPEFPFGYYAHGALNLQDFTITETPLYDYITIDAFKPWVLSNEFYFHYPKSFVVALRFYIPDDFPVDTITREFGGWFSWKITVIPDGTSTVKWFYPVISYNTTIFQRGHSYLVTWVYANYSLLTWSLIRIVRDDGVIQEFTPPHQVFSNTLENIVIRNATFPLEDLVVFYDYEDRPSNLFNALQDIAADPVKYTQVELYNPEIHDEQVYFVEKITYTVEEQNNLRALYTLELSDIANLQTVVAPFTINYQENTVRDTDAFGLETYYTIQNAITPTYANYIRAFLHLLALFKMPFDIDYDFIVIGSDDYNNLSYFFTTYNYNIKTGTRGHTTIQLIYGAPYAQLYLRTKVSPDSLAVFLEFILINQQGRIRKKGWWIFASGGYTIQVRTGRPATAVDGDLHFVYLPIDVKRWNSWLMEMVYNSYLFDIYFKRDGEMFDVLVVNAKQELGFDPGHVDVGGASAVQVKFENGWKVYWIIHSLLNAIFVGFVRYNDLYLSSKTSTFLPITITDEIHYRFGETMRTFTDDYKFYNFDVWETGIDTYKCVLVSPLKGACIFTINIGTGAGTYDGFVPEIQDVRWVKTPPIGAVAIWKGNVILWRRDLPHNSRTPLMYNIIPVKGEEVVVLEYNDGSNGHQHTTILIRDGRNILGTPPGIDLTPYFVFLSVDGSVVDGFFAEIGEVNTDSFKNGIRNNDIYFTGRNQLISRLEFQTTTWSLPGRFRIGIPIVMKMQLWGFQYEMFGYLYVSEQATPLTTKNWNANVKEGVIKFDKIGEIQQGLYRLVHVYKWNRAHLKHGPVKTIRVYDLQVETIYVKEIIASKYLTGVIWDYITENDVFVIDEIETAQDIIERLSDNNKTLKIWTSKTPDKVNVGDVVLIYWNDALLAKLKVIALNRDNNFITTFTGVKLPL